MEQDAYNRLYSDIGDKRRAWDSIRKGEPHILCQRTSDGDTTDYRAWADEQTKHKNGEVQDVDIEKKRQLEQGASRMKTTLEYSVVIGLDEATAGTWIPEFKANLNAGLSKCDQCIRNWHLCRGDIVKRLQKDYIAQVATIMELRYDAIDFERINTGLQVIEAIIDKAGPGATVTPTQILKTRGINVLLPLLESLCSLRYLSMPEHRPKFDKIFVRLQEKKVLKLGGSGILPAMTRFLFDPNPIRQRFARTAWSGIREGSINLEEWDWAVGDELARQMQAVATSIPQLGSNGPSPNPAIIQPFWERFSIMLNSFSKDIFVKKLGLTPTHNAGAEEKNAYFLAMSHLSCDSAFVLAQLFSVFSTLLTKAPDSFWTVFVNFARQGVAESFVTARHFPTLLANGELVTHTSTPVALCWLRPLLDSLKHPTLLQAVGIDFFVPFFLDSLPLDKNWGLNPNFLASATWGALVTFQMAIDTFRDAGYKINTNDSLVGISQVIEKLVLHKKVVVSSTGRMPKNEYGLQLERIATDLLRSALQLDCTAFQAEWVPLDIGTIIQDRYLRKSVELWEAALDVVKPGNYQTSSVVVSAALQFLQTETLIAKKHKQLAAVADGWNTRLARTAGVIGHIFDRLCDFSEADQHRFLADMPVLKSIIHALFNSNQELNAPALQFIKSATDQDNRDDAIRELLSANLRTFLTTHNNALSYHCAGNFLNWGPILQILSLNRTVCTALCDPADGLLRTRLLSPAEQVLVFEWWKGMWSFVHRALRDTEDWSKNFSIDKRVLSDFVRDAMQFADDMLDQDGVFATALCPQGGDKKANDAVMKRILTCPQECTGLSKMIRLRDQWLISVIVKILTKLFNRLHEYQMPANNDVSKLIKDTCMPIPGSQIKFTVNTNLLPTQRAQLAQALRIRADDDEEDDADDDAVVITGSKSLSDKPKPKKQTVVSSWARSGVASSSSSIQDVMKELTPTVSKPSTSTSVLSLLKSKENNMKKLREEREAKKAKAQAEANALKQVELKHLQGSIKERRRKEKEAQDKAKAAIIARAKALRAPKPLVQGEGSGLNSIGGSRGKTALPMPNKSELMLNSDSEPDDDGDDGIKELLERNKQPHMNELERQLALRSTGGPVKKTRILRDEKANRARIAPSMDKLHAKLLAWDIFHKGEDPPGTEGCLRVASNYRSPSDYKNTFTPMLIHEAWRAFVTAKAECTQKPFALKVTTRMSVDSFIEIGTAIPASENKDRFLSEGDIVILSRSKEPLADEGAEHILARIKDTKFRRGAMDITYRVSRDPQSSLKPSRINPGTELYAIKVTNMTTIEREFAALESLQHFDLCQEIIKAEPSPMLQFSDERIQKTLANYQLNQAQALAVLNATENDGFTLVQGPPGTGKTKTIVAMVGSLLTGSLNSSSRAVPVPRVGGRPAPTVAGPQKKLLVCAPSNAAVDEIVLRLKQGVTTQNGSLVKINVVRLGRVDVINAAVKDVSLDGLVKQRMDEDASNNKDGGLLEKEDLHKRAGELKTKISELRPRLESARIELNAVLETTLQREYDTLKKDQSQIGRQIDILKDKGNTRDRDNKIRRLRIEQEFIDKAHVVCTTLSGSGHHMFRDLKGVDFETVIIDEAAQCIELSALIPLKYGCIKCILVGDPKQLPPTVLSMSAQRYGYDQSLFVRMQQNYASFVHLLDHQYRMHPEISMFPSKEFYDNKLQDGNNMWDTRTQPWHKSLYLGPYRFFDVAGTQSHGNRGASLVNQAEVIVAIKLYTRFQADYGAQFDGKIGIITPYKAQLFRLRDEFSRNFGEEIFDRIEFNTTDAFQGRECDIIIFSCVRANPTGGIGFMTDIRRMNVGLTRAKSSLWVLGHGQALEQGTYWKRLIEDAKARNLHTPVGMGQILSQPGPTVKLEELKRNSKTEFKDLVMLDDDGEPVVLPPKDQDNGSLLQGMSNTSAVLSTPGRVAPKIPPPLTSRPMPVRPGNNSMHPPSPVPNAPIGPASDVRGDSRKRPYPAQANTGYPNKRNASSGQYHRPSHRDQDPAAMEELGLVAPDRPPPSTHAGPVGPTINPPRRPGGLLPGKGRPQHKGSNVFIQKPRRRPPQ